MDVSICSFFRSPIPCLRLVLLLITQCYPPLFGSRNPKTIRFESSGIRVRSLAVKDLVSKKRVLEGGKSASWSRMGLASAHVPGAPHSFPVIPVYTFSARQAMSNTSTLAATSTGMHG